MNASHVIESVRKIPVLSRGLRWWAGQYPENSIVRIKTGCASGLLWRRHHRYVNGYWIGYYELPIQDALKRQLRSGDTFFDVGANAGFFTLVAANLVGATGRCVAFEPAPANCTSIREQIELNSLSHCSLVPEAISDGAGKATFSFADPGSPMGHLGHAAQNEREIEVDVTTLDAACARFGRPNFIKMDIEGAEAKALAGAKRTLNEIRPGWLIELHGPDCERQVKRTLLAADYVFLSLRGDRLPPSNSLPQHFIAQPN